MKRSIAAIFIGVGLMLIAVALIAFTGEGGDTFINLRDGEQDTADSTSIEDLPVSPERGALAPNFTLESVSGEVVRLNDFKGKYVMVNFWAVWCPPCLEEMPLIQSVHEEYGDQMVVLAINAGDAKEDAVSFLESNGLSFETLLDVSNKVESQYRVRGIPTTFFIDPQGIIQILHVGIMQESQVLGYLSDLGLVE